MTVTCITCARYLPGQPLPSQSMGRCTATLTGLPPAGGQGHRAPYPHAPRTCTSFQHKEPTS